MTWILIGLAEIWRWRWKIGVPVLLGLVWGAMHVLVFKEPFEARVLLQLQSEQAREPLLQKITARGHKEALYQKLTNPDVLADSGRELGVTIHPEQVKLLIFNDHFLGISYSSMQREKLEQVVDNLAFNFIQQVLAPERARIERMLADDKQQLVDVITQIESAQKGAPGALSVNGQAPVAEVGLVETLGLKRRQLENEILQLQTDLRLVNTAFGQSGSEALLWFAQPGVLVEQTPLPLRLLLWMLWGGVLGYAASYAVFRLPEKWKHTVVTAKDVHNACGLPLVGQLPWLGKVKIGPAGAVVKAQGHTLRPSAFGEVGRLQASLTKGLRGALVLVGVQGLEGVTLATLLLGERTASLGKATVIADLNLKNRGLSHLMGGKGEAWSLPRKKGSAWSALHDVTGQENLKLLAAPRAPETLRTIGEPGGVHKLMEALDDNADTVLVDASPVSATNRGNIDAVALAAAGKRVVLVALAGVTMPGELRQAADTLLLSGAHVQGVLLNMQQRPSRRQLLGEMADYLGPLGKMLRRAAMGAKLE